MKNRLLTPERVQDIAYSNEEYTPPGVVNITDIAAVEQRYLIPVIGEELYAALAGGDYVELLEEYVAPAVALYVREIVDTPSSPSSKRGLQSARVMMLRLSYHLEENTDSYPEYRSADNILTKCRINGVHIQIP